MLETFWTACIDSLKNQFPELEICINSAAMHQFPNSSLYLVINPEQCKFGSVVETALNAVKGGVTTIQVRSKAMNDQDFVETTANLVRELACFHVPVIVNDRVEAVTAANASGVHLGQEDASVIDARDTLGNQRIIGLTVRSLEEAADAPLDLIDYISIGGVFRTASKENHDPPIGLDELQIIVNSIRSRKPEIPIIAISGINEFNAMQVMSTGVDGIAVVSAICESPDPEGAALRLRRIIGKARPERMTA